MNRVRAATSGTTSSPPASRSKATGSVKFPVCGPQAMATPRRAGSSGFCPPPGGIRLRPTNALPHRRYHSPISPRVSAIQIPSSGGICPNPRRGASSSVASAGPRSGCRGAIMVSNPGNAGRSASCTARISVSSPGWVLAASHTGRPARRAVNSRSVSGSAGKTGAARFRSPSTVTEPAPRARRRAASSSPRAWIRANPPNTDRAAAGTRAQAAAERADRRALISIVGIARARHAARMLGQSSLSTNPAASGRQ